MTTYTIRRVFHSGEHSQNILNGLTLEEAKAHCNDSESSSSTATSKHAKAITAKYGAWMDTFVEE